MRLSLLGTRALKLNIHQHGLPEDADDDAVYVPGLGQSPGTEYEGENEYEFNFNYAKMEGADDKYAIIFTFSTILTSQAICLDLEYIAEFKADQPLPDDFHDSHFANVNSPAIAFPYLRAYISNILLASGYNPLVLPSINFQTLNKEK